MAFRDEGHGDKFLEGPQQTAMLRTLFPQAAFVSTERSIRVPVNLRSKTLMSILDALIDSGATDNFLSPIVVKYFNLPTKELDKPKTIWNVDGTKNTIGDVTQTVDLSLKFIKNQKQQVIHVQTFYIADLGSDYMLLGFRVWRVKGTVKYYILDWCYYNKGKVKVPL